MTTDTIRLLDGVKKVQSLALDFDTPIVHVSSADPYLIALTEEGEMILISLDTPRPNRPEISILKANLKSRSRLVAACAYKDISGLFTTETPEEIVNNTAATLKKESVSQGNFNLKSKFYKLNLAKKGIKGLSI